MGPTVELGCPQWPAGGFADIEAARAWVHDFILWYNHEHRHSRIRFVTPVQRHRGEDRAILAGRHALYQQARAPEFDTFLRK